MPREDLDSGTEFCENLKQVNIVWLEAEDVAVDQS